MAQKMRKSLYKLKKNICSVFKREKSDPEFILEPVLCSPLTIEKRRKEALGYLVEKYFEGKKREEEYLKKLESYGRFRRWLYKRAVSLKHVGMVVKELMVKPSIITMLICSTYFSVWLGTTLGPKVAEFTAMHISHPSKYVLDVLILFPIGFSPAILSIVLNYHMEKKKLKRALENYGIRI